MNNPKKRKAAITSAQVVAYLTEHPQFFLDQDDLLAQLSVPHA